MDIPQRTSSSPITGRTGKARRARASRRTRRRPRACLRRRAGCDAAGSGEDNGRTRTSWVSAGADPGSTPGLGPVGRCTGSAAQDSNTATAISSADGRRCGSGSSAASMQRPPARAATPAQRRQAAGDGHRSRGRAGRPVNAAKHTAARPWTSEAGVGGSPASTAGSRIAGRAGDDAGRAKRLAHQPAHPEVAQQRSAVAGEQDVGRSHVAVHQPSRVHSR